MLIIVYGEDTFRVQEKVKELQTAFTKKFDPTGLNLSVFESGTPAGEILQAMQSLPFMSQKRMVVVKEVIATTKKDGEEAWAALARTPESAIVVMLETTNVEKKALFQKLTKPSTNSPSSPQASSGSKLDVHLYNFSILEGSLLSKWTTNRIRSSGGQIAPDALYELCDRVGGNLWQMNNEIQKLIGFTKNPINKSDVENLVRATFEGEIFALIDAVSQKQGDKAIKLLFQERESGASDFQIFSMLARQVRILLGARAMLDENPHATSSQLAIDMDLHPFVAQKSLLHAKRYTLQTLRSTHDLLFHYDAGMKSGLLDAELAVDLVTTRLVST